MSYSELPATSHTVVTSGFAAVDVMINGSVCASPGGTAVNVAAILARLGWHSEVAGTIGTDPAGLFLAESLEADGVGTHSLRLFDQWKTPIVVQERRRDDHAWRFACPACGARFAKHRPSEVAYATAVVEQLPAPDVFFFDRVSLFTIELARRWKEAGSLVFFEPAGLGRPALFDRAVDVSDVVKYSAERAPAFAERLPTDLTTLIETLGPAGARIRIDGVWTDVPGHPVTALVDSAGAGDWTSAGIIDALFTSGGEPDWERALVAGQRLGADACGWEGVRPEPATHIAGDFEAFGCPRMLSERRTNAQMSLG
ncbi:ribokinase [Curtobacterium sp. MCJR17_055]|uniref:carbohydrate kinase family protein n=1 Tax=unclassified Curtobacterium TaxID=257496 RepID=UPI000D821477|nr:MULTISPECIES: PfkB family carbohydrate kinase [unclassified Curtobacterium]PYY38167.1 ribokinase [Curtobacterium sp. MCBD17_029]PYY57221.1 ribokinase [Curtobacterium sp. MCJR17_055]PYY62429.1 ribokinase [Curtobacterium sp. MCPF17_015]WIB36190.1 PfkB family carbohydrate kinase [Curtobacterium sp. MCJR17_043]